jgi:hypothetical protein
MLVMLMHAAIPIREIDDQINALVFLVILSFTLLYVATVNGRL